jgi:hypothetical protein
MPLEALLILAIALQRQPHRINAESENSISGPNPFPGWHAVAFGDLLRSIFSIEHFWNQSDFFFFLTK